MITYQEAVEWITGVGVLTNGAAAAGFASRRNTAAMGVVRTLAAHFPTVVRILGEEAFLDVAARFIAEQPPTMPTAIFYGEGLPRFLRKVGTVASADYVADIAEIEAALIKARHIVDATETSHDPLIAIPAGERSMIRAELHPSMLLLRSKYPAVTGWHANQPNGDRWIRRWGPEDALVACPRLDAGVWRLPVGGFEFLTALSAGATFEAAGEAAAAASSAFDFAEALAVLIASDIVTRVRRVKPDRHRTHVKLVRHQLLAVPAAVA